MSRALVITAEAGRDIAEASQWYDEMEPGVGRKFELALDRAFERIRQTPELYRVRGRRDIRRCRPEKWPYGIYTFAFWKRDAKSSPLFTMPATPSI